MLVVLFCFSFFLLLQVAFTIYASVGTAATFLFAVSPDLPSPLKLLLCATFFLSREPSIMAHGSTIRRAKDLEKHTW